MTFSISMANCTLDENDAVGRPSRDSLRVGSLPV